MTHFFSVCVSVNVFVIYAYLISVTSIMIVVKRKQFQAPARYTQSKLVNASRARSSTSSVINIDKTSGAWLMDGKIIEHPDLTLPALEQKCRFSADFNTHFNQHNPVAIFQGTLDSLNTLAASRSIMTKKEHTDTADYLMPVQLSTLRAARVAIKNKNFEEAYDILSLQQLGDKSRLMRRGRKIEVDGRVSLIKQSWFKSPHLLVSVILYPDLIKIGLFGGKRDCKLTTTENMAQGGETSKQACVREVQEESGLTIAEDVLMNIDQQDTRSSTIFYSIVI